MSKKKLRIKKRRHIDIDQLFRRKANYRLMLMDWSIRQAFPDPVERQKYIAALYKGLAEEKSCEII